MRARLALVKRVAVLAFIPKRDLHVVDVVLLRCIYRLDVTYLWSLELGTSVAKCPQGHFTVRSDMHIHVRIF